MGAVEFPVCHRSHLFQKVRIERHLARRKRKTAVGILNDITETRNYQQQLEHQTNFDLLTELPNRNLLQDRIQQAVALARLSFLPRADLLLQANRASHNNVYGLILPNTVIPAISGPVLDTSKFRNVFGSAAGVLVSWEPFDFGLRQAGVDAASASKRRAELSIEKTKFEVAAVTADSYLTILAAQRNIDAALAALERTRQLETLVGALVKAELRPGVDLSRLKAEQAVATTFLYQARQAEQVARAALGQMVGMEAARGELAGAKFLTVAPEAATANEEHPAIAEQAAAIDEVKLRQLILDKSLYPKLNVQGTLYGRGTGASIIGQDQGGLNGLGPNIGNWALSFSMTWSALDYKTLRVKKEIESANERKETARRNVLSTEVNGAAERARAMMAGARQIATVTPEQVSALKTTLEQLTARYRAGLGTLIEVADAQRMLSQAEVDDSLARLNVWRTQLSLAIAQGDLKPFLDMAR